jgi:glucose-6-phosphate isomerase
MVRTRRYCREKLGAGIMTVSVQLGSGFADLSESISNLINIRFASRLSAGDATLWGPDAQAEASVRLRWLNVLEEANDVVDQARQLRDELRERGIHHVVLSGMGGSSLAPELICQTARQPLTVLDSTHPDQVSRALSEDLSATVLVVSSKSGSTIETTSHRELFTKAFADAGLNPADHIVVVTDPGSPLAASAEEVGSRVFTADPNVGGRYSALTAFGLVPSILAGVDVEPLLEQAKTTLEQISHDAPSNPALQLGAALASGIPEQFALVIAPNPVSDVGLGQWIEQLIAESTGKEEAGMLPVAVRGASPESGEQFPAHALRAWVPLSPSRDLTADEFAVTGELGSQFIVWEAAVTVLGALLGINPFDQPDVESAKVAARNVLSDKQREPRPEIPLTDAPAVRIGGYQPEASSTLKEEITALIHQVVADSYLAIQAYVDRESPAAPRYYALRDELAAVLPVPVTLGFGPRFLHSTGQFHKGGPRVGVFLQIRDVPQEDIDIPQADTTFGALIEAQADGDAQVLLDLGRPVLELRVFDSSVVFPLITEFVSEAERGAHS